MVTGLRHVAAAHDDRPCHVLRHLGGHLLHDNSAFSLHLLASVPAGGPTGGWVVAMLIVATPLVGLAWCWTPRGARVAGPARAARHVCRSPARRRRSGLRGLGALHVSHTAAGRLAHEDSTGFTILNLVVQFVVMDSCSCWHCRPSCRLFVHLGSGAAVWSWLALAGLVEGLVPLWLGV
ncbi:hypothetical protein QJS66_00390 [Kocuria rhizophila]|nr:hypothetical protein QJS66_00390 [Kocuria rhizophila]